MHRPDLSGADCEVTNGIGGIIFNIFTINLFLLIRLQEDGEFDYNRTDFRHHTSRSACPQLTRIKYQPDLRHVQENRTCINCSNRNPMVMTANSIRLNRFDFKYSPMRNTNAIGSNRTMIK
jgi:hypothetical protein